MIQALLLIFFLISPAINANTIEKSTVNYEKFALERWFDGTVEAVHQSTVSAQTNGRIAQLFFDIGDEVNAGAVILTIVSNEQRALLNQAEAKFAETEANFDATTKDFARIDSLYKQHSISKAEWDRATAHLNIAKAQVASAEAVLKTAKEHLNYTEVHAPYSGVVSARHVELGESVQIGTPLMTGFDPNAMRVRVALPQIIANKVRVLKRARIVNDDNESFTPEKITLYPTADSATSTISVRLELPEINTHLYPGEFVRVGFTVGDVYRLLIPYQSVVFRSEVSGVYTINDNKPTLRQVRLGNRFGQKIEIIAGLELGENIATDPIAAGIALHTASGI